MTELPIRRALVSVYDKDGLVPFCRDLHAMGIDIVSTGGTAGLLRNAEIPVSSVADLTGFPEMLDGRVKTLHPRIHGGILAVRSNPGHMEDLRAHAIAPIDLVVVNLYPFEKTAAREGIGLDDVVEMIDVGGPSMVRGAAKNFSHVGVVVDPSDYPAVLEEIKARGHIPPSMRLDLAAKAFRHTASYDAAIAGYLARVGARGGLPEGRTEFPEKLSLVYLKALDLVYGENPHQAAAFYLDPLATGPSIARAVQLQGKPLSFNNILDFDASLGLAADLAEGACVIVKHGNPCGAALATEPGAAFLRALECDPTSAFGGVIAFNRAVDASAAAAIAEAFYEGVVAPAFDEGARDLLARKKNLRLLTVGDLGNYRRDGRDLRRVAGGILLQDWDRSAERVRGGRVVTRRPPSDVEWRALEFAWTVVRHVKSNAIVYAFADRLAGVGAGQMSRVDSARLAVQKARVPLAGAVVASDAFFPFRDGLDVAADAGITAVVQPGGSIRDAEVVAAADERGLAMVFTDHRHFRH